MYRFNVLIMVLLSFVTTGLTHIQGLARDTSDQGIANYGRRQVNEGDAEIAEDGEWLYGGRHGIWKTGQIAGLNAGLTAREVPAEHTVTVTVTSVPANCLTAPASAPVGPAPMTPTKVTSETSGVPAGTPGTVPSMNLIVPPVVPTTIGSGSSAIIISNLTTGVSNTRVSSKITSTERASITATSGQATSPSPTTSTGKRTSVCGMFGLIGVILGWPLFREMWKLLA